MTIILNQLIFHQGINRNNKPDVNQVPNTCFDHYNTFLLNQMKIM